MSLEPGVPAERTVLAWQRTALASVVLAGLLIRVAASAFPLAAAVAVGVFLALTGILGATISFRRADALRRRGLGAGPLTPRGAAGIAASAVAVGVVAVAVGALVDGLFEL